MIAESTYVGECSFYSRAKLESIYGNRCSLCVIQKRLLKMGFDTSDAGCSSIFEMLTRSFEKDLI